MFIAAVLGSTVLALLVAASHADDVVEAQAPQSITGVPSKP